MKLINLRMYVVIMFLGAPNAIFSAPGCQDNSRHLERGTIDYKQWHYVACSCPCDKYQLRPDSRCSECEHLHTAVRLVRPQQVSPTQVLNISKLEAWSDEHRVE